MVILPWFAPLMWAILVLALLWFVSVVGPFFLGAPWVPMPVAQARQMLTLAGVQPGEQVWDLGSGDGRLLIVAAREFGAQAVGVEIEPLRALLSQLTLLVMGLHHRARIIRANIFEVDLGEAQVVTLYLLPKALTRLIPQLRQQLKPGARIVTLTYPLPGWQPLHTEGDIRVYQIPV
jgi:Ribosomal protein L11 methyltransferase (PrmA)